jgi:UDP-N-acetyl-2-amino-2-deoxyglucuronate dehydrogenase
MTAARVYGFVIVGCGVISAFHVKALSELDNARLVAVVDEVPEKATMVAEKAGVIALPSLDAALSMPGVDVVCVCVPSGLHAEVGIQAAEAGKHVIVEKPIDVSLAAADRLINACSKHSCSLTVISQRRFDSVFRRVHDIVQQNGLGQLILGGADLKWYRSQEYYDSADWRGTWKLDGGGALMNQGVHYVDLLRWIMGPVASITARCSTKAHEGIEVEDIALAHLEFASGALGSIVASTAVFPGLAERLELTGTLGTAVVEEGALRLLETQGTRTPVPLPNDDASDKTASSDPTRIGTQGHTAQFADFLSAIDDDREPFVTGADGRAAIEVILGVYEAARREKTVTLPLEGSIA